MSVREVEETEVNTSKCAALRSGFLVNICSCR